MAKKKTNIKEKKWLEAEGKLVVDVIENNDFYIIQSAIAGIDAKKLEIVFKNDMLSIKGNRPRPSNEKGDYLLEECYWGPFSRQVSLDNGVDPSKIRASAKDGILTIRVPKIPQEQKNKIEVKS
jgi:HSP20 family protein